MNKIISLLACICLVLVFVEFLVLSRRSWNVLWWGNHLSAGFADMLRQERGRRVSQEVFLSTLAEIIEKKFKLLEDWEEESDNQTQAKLVFVDQIFGKSWFVYLVSEKIGKTWELFGLSQEIDENSVFWEMSRTYFVPKKSVFRWK